MYKWDFEFTQTDGDIRDTVGSLVTETKDIKFGKSQLILTTTLLCL